MATAEEVLRWAALRGGAAAAGTAAHNALIKVCVCVCARACVRVCVCAHAYEDVRRRACVCMHARA